MGERIVSQYGLVCDVLREEDVGGRKHLVCRSLYKGKVWTWPVEATDPIDGGGEVRDRKTGEAYGRVEGDRVILYPDEVEAFLRRELAGDKWQMRRACQFWDHLRCGVGCRRPSVSVSEGGDVLFFWDDEEHHFEAELRNTREGAPVVEFFYRNRETGESWGEESPLHGEVPERTAAALRTHFGEEG